MNDSDHAIPRRTVVICNERGLHARAAAKFVKLVERFEADVTVTVKGTGVSGLSIMGLMMLAAGSGTEVEIAATGSDAASVVGELASLIEAGFEED
jgi:phosphocarrier protein